MYWKFSIIMNATAIHEGRKIDLSTMDTNVLTVHIPISQQRRAKQLVPETQKDSNYWQKRQRNNLAAKKSRENKRQYECMVRARVITLEEENCLLKRELDLIKERFNIPKDASFLSSSDREECLLQCKQTFNFNENSRMQRDTSSFGNSDSNSCSSNSINDYSRNENSAESSYTPIKDEIVWSLTPAHSHSLERYAESSRIYRNEISSKEIEVMGESFRGNKRKRTVFENNIKPADLSIRQNSSTEKSSFGSAADNKSNIERRNNNFSVEDQRLDVNGFSNKPIDLTNDNSEIKCKLQILSDQVERMQKLVCNSSERENIR